MHPVTQVIGEQALVDFLDLSEVACTCWGVSTPRSGLGLRMVKELDLQLALGMNERRKTGWWRDVVGDGRGVLRVSHPCWFWSWCGPMEKMHDIVQLRTPGPSVAPLVLAVTDCQEDQ